MGRLKALMATCIFLMFSANAVANGTAIISSVEYVYLLKDSKVPTLVIVTSDEEIERLADKAAEESVLKARIKDTPITMKLRARDNDRGLVGHIDGWGYRVLVVSKDHAADLIY